MAQMTSSQFATIMGQYHCLVLSLSARQIASRLSELGHPEWNYWLDTTLCRLQTLTSCQDEYVWRRFIELILRLDIDPYDRSTSAIQLRKRLVELCTKMRVLKKTWRKPWEKYLALAQQLESEDTLRAAARTASADLLRAAKPGLRIALNQNYCQSTDEAEASRQYVTHVLLETIKSLRSEPLINRVLANLENVSQDQLEVVFHVTVALRALENIAQMAKYIVAGHPSNAVHQATVAAYIRLAIRLEKLLLPYVRR